MKDAAGDTVRMGIGLVVMALIFGAPFAPMFARMIEGEPKWENGQLIPATEWPALEKKLVLVRAVLWAVCIAAWFGLFLFSTYYKGI